MRDDTNTKFLLLRVQTAYIYDLGNERWLFGDIIDHVRIYGSRVAEGLSASNVGLVADDTNLFCTGKNLGDIVNEINVEIDKLYSWVKANKLSLNVEKTNFMLFTPKCFPRNMDDLLINGNRISEVNETKFLGVIIDNKLNWSPHIMHISKKIAKGIGIILKARKVFDNETLFSLFIYPYLNYCIHVWGKAYDTHLHHLIVLQNKAIRIINGIPATNQCGQCVRDA